MRVKRKRGQIMSSTKEEIKKTSRVEGGREMCLKKTSIVSAYETWKFSLADYSIFSTRRPASFFLSFPLTLFS